MSEREEITDYLLGELGEFERARLERRMQEDAALRERVDAMRDVVGRLDTLAPEAWAHVAGGAAAAPDRPARLRARRSLAGRRSTRKGLSAGATLGAALVAVAAAVIALAAGSGSRPAGPHPHTVVLSALAGSPPAARAVARITGADHVQMTVEHLPATDRAHHYELWLMTDTTHLLAVASFRVGADGGAHLSLSLPASPAGYRYLNVSLQRDGAGSAISTQSVLRGPTY